MQLRRMEVARDCSKHPADIKGFSSSGERGAYTARCFAHVPSGSGADVGRLQGEISLCLHLLRGPSIWNQTQKANGAA